MKSMYTTAFLTAIGAVLAHPEKLTAEKAKQEPALVGRSSGNCARAIEARKAEIYNKRALRLKQRRAAPGVSKRNELKYTTIQNNTCVLAPETVWGPYGIDGEIVRHDLRELSSGQEGLDLYLDIGVIYVTTCEPLPAAAVTIRSCNATAIYAGFTGIDPDTASICDGWTTRSNGLTDDEIFLRGIQTTDESGMVEFLTHFPYSQSAVQHLGQLFFDEDLINSVYNLSPYSAHLATLNRTTNAEAKLFSTVTAGGYSAPISVEQIGDGISEGLVGYITIGVNSTADDRADGYTS
ncbi:aromatic compound dioxygenase [Thozetella sp. PMI_491]|nr:aromatic compound dioxygenase [Thozetella sp. PMI_491]